MGNKGLFGLAKLLFRKPSAEVLAQQELEDARRELLQCQRMRDYYDSMTNFNNTRINRVQQMLSKEKPVEQ